MKSMTGFSELKKDFDGFSLGARIKSVNGKYLDYQIKGDEFIAAFESSIARILKEHIGRGRVTLWIDAFIEDENMMSLSFNTTLVEPLIREFSPIQEKYPAFNFSLPLNTYLSSSSSFVKTELLETGRVRIEHELETLLLQLIEAYNLEREREGTYLNEDILNRLTTIEQSVEKIGILREGFFDSQLQLFREKMQALLGEGQIDENRIIQEAGLMADKLDISEEITRMGAHISAFRNTAKSNEPVGKKLDFFIQEMVRETNTMGSKGRNENIAHLVIDIKSELEKIREQIQNIE